MRNTVIVVVITAIVSVTLTLTVVRLIRATGASGIGDAESCRDALVEIDVICQSMPRNDAEQRVDRLLATPNFYRCGDPRWHDYEPSYVSCFANHERAKQIRTELDAWWSAHPEQPREPSEPSEAAKQAQERKQYCFDHPTDKRCEADKGVHISKHCLDNPLAEGCQ